MKMIKSQFMPAFLLSFVILFSMGMAPYPAAKWKKYTSEVCKAKISFPAEFTEESPEESDYGKTYKVTAEDGSTQYFFAATVHKNPLDEHYELAKIGMESFAESVGGDLSDEGDYIYKSHRGVKGDISKDGVLIRYRTILIGQIQYQIIVIYTEGAPDAVEEAKASKFFNSFKVLK